MKTVKYRFQRAGYDLFILREPFFLWQIFLSQMELIVFSKNQPFVVLYDECDHELISSKKWYVLIDRKKPNRTPYVYTVLDYTTRKYITMHRLLLDINQTNIHADHINHNGLDNRRDNLRICNKAQNNRNQRTKKGKPYKGTQKTKYGKYAASIHANNKHHYICGFDNEIDAAQCYDLMAVYHSGEFAFLNFPEKIEVYNHILSTMSIDDIKYLFVEKDTRYEDKINVVVEYLNTNGICTRSEIQDGTGFLSKSVRRILIHLLSKTIIELVPLPAGRSMPIKYKLCVNEEDN